jgi:hypothetical protein
MTFENLEKFQAFLEENLNTPHADINDYLEDLKEQVGASGGANYELSPFKTKSGNPENIGFERIDKYFLDGAVVEPVENNFDYVETTIIF